MDGKLRTLLSLSLRVARASKRTLDKTIRLLEKASKVEPHQAKSFAKKALRELRAEQKRVSSFLKSEAKRELSKAERLLSEALSEKKVGKKRRRKS